MRAKWAKSRLQQVLVNIETKHFFIFTSWKRMKAESKHIYDFWRHSEKFPTSSCCCEQNSLSRFKLSFHKRNPLNHGDASLIPQSYTLVSNLIMTWHKMPNELALLFTQRWRRVYAFESMMWSFSRLFFTDGMWNDNLSPPSHTFADD